MRNKPNCIFFRLWSCMLPRCKSSFQQWNYVCRIFFFFVNAKMFLETDFIKMIEWVALVNKSLSGWWCSQVFIEIILKWWMSFSYLGSYCFPFISLLYENLITDLKPAWVKKSINMNTKSAFVVVKDWFEKSELYHHTTVTYIWQTFNRTCCSLWWITYLRQVSSQQT